MTQQEQQMIDGLINRIRNADVQSKDAEAEQYIQQGLSNDNNALYVLVQTVLVQQYGLQQAQSQLNELKQQNQTLQDQLQQASQQAKSSGGSFLSHIFGGASGSQSAPTGTASGQYQPVSNPGYGSQGYPAPPPPPPVAYPPTSYPSAGGGFGGGGFLQGALQTAAGVAAGEIAFQGMEDLFHGFGGRREGFGGAGGETIVNNYYDDDRNSGASQPSREFSDAGRDDSNFYNPSDDASRTSYDTADQNSADMGNDANFAGSDDMSSIDDSSDSGNDFTDDGGGDFSGSDDNT